MAKQLNVDMRFTADTAKAKQAITDLEQSLQKLGHSSMPKNSGIDPAQFEKASAAARELEFHLKNAFNEKTGNLDLSKLQASLQQSHTNLNQLTSGFSRAGQVGQQAFVNLARAIATADQPSLTLNTHLSTMWTTLKNVARFQISSSIMHGLIGGIQTAYGYAQDLNESLNNIRIVTGQSTSQMARFAEQANKGAKALSATTLDYTNASLIYYQQGLDDNAVRERTEVTLKMANVARESAETISEQLTAIWNNFDNGSKSLEYYADVITALGAATASSSSEISAGLNKFAAVADTVGLSYENATAALATITATTRQSADTVGTGLRTLFSRLQGLSLGKTLEDGVNLNKYSQALAKVGVQALDSSGNLRRMDDVLEDLGARWGDLTEAQQTALAQTVGGVRQYTTLVALMDNWDFMKQNQEVAANAEGTLQEQADIYAESWEAARDRVKAAAESIFQALLDDKFFIGITNMIEQVLTGVKSFIDSFGGLKALMVPLLGFVFQMISNKISPAIQKIVQDIQILSGGAGKVYRKVQQETNQMVDAEMSRKTVTGADLYSQKDQASLQGSKAILAAKTQLSMMEDRLSASEKMRVQIAISGIETQVAAYEQLGAKIDDVTAKIIKQTEEERKKAKETIQKKDSIVDEFKEETQGAREERVRQSKREVWSKLTGSESSLIEKGFDKETIGAWLQQSENQVNEFGNNLHNALIQAFADGATDITFIMQTAFEDFNIQDYVTFADKDMGQTQLQILYDQIQDLVAVSPEVADAFNEALDPDVTNFEDSAKKVQQVLKDFILNYDELGGKAEQVMKVMGINPTQIASFKKVQQEAQKLQEELEKLEDIAPDINVKKLAKEMLEAKKKGESLADIFKRFKIPENLQDQFSNLIDVMDDAETASKSLQKSADNIDFSHLMSKSEFITSAASGLTQIASSIQAAYSLVRAWSNDDLTFGEKITQSLMSIGMFVPSAIGAYNQLKAVIDTTKSAFQGLTVAKALNAAITKKATATEIAAIAISKGLITAKKGEEKAALQKALAEEIEALAAENNGKITLKTIINAIKNTAAKVNEAGAHGVNAGAIIGETVAQNALNASMLIGVGIVLAVIAGVAALVGIIYLAVKAYNADAEAAKRAAEAAKGLAEASQEAAQKAEEIKNVFSQYGTAVEALEKCTTGTEEWYAALKKVNDEVLNILEQHPELVGKLDITRENGQLKINNADEIIKEAEQNAQNAQYASLLGQQIAKSAQLTADRTATLRSIDYENTTDEDGLTIDEAVERNRIRTTIVNNAEDYLGLTKDEFAKQISEQGLTLQGAALDKFYDSVMALAESAENAAISIRKSSEVIAEDVLGEEYKDNENSGAIKGFAAATLAQANQQAYNDAKELSDKLDINSSAYTLKNSEFFKKYVEAVGGNINDYIVSGNAVLGSDNNRSYKFIDDAGKEQTLSAEQMAAVIAAFETTGGLNDVAAEFANKIPDIQKQSGGQALIDFLTNDNFGQTSQVDLEALQNLINENNGNITEALNTIFGEDLVDKLGPDFISDIEAKINSIDFNAITDKYVAPVRTTINQAGEDFKQLSSVEQREVGDFLTSFYANSSQEEYDAFNKTLAKISDTQKDEFLKLTTDYDWENGSLEDFKSQLIDLGIDVAQINLNPWINAMLRAQEVINSFENIDSKWVNINKIIGKLNIGDTLDFDKYQELIKIDPIFEEYFVQLKDGSYRLMREVEEINDLETEERLKAIRSQEKRVNELKELQEREQNGEQTGFSAEERRNIKLGLTNPIAAARRGINANSIAPESILQMLNAMQGYNGQDFTDLITKTKSGEGLTFEDLQHIDEQYTEYLNSIQEQQNALEEEYNKIAQSATDVGDLQDQAAKFGLSVESIQKGYESLATTTDEGRLALSKYRKEMEKYEEGSKEAKAATDKFQKAIKDIQANKVADSIRKLYKNYDALTDIDFDNIAKQLQTVFGKDVTDEFVKNNKELIQQWLNGTEEERQAAANTIDIITGTQRILNDLDPAQSTEAMNYLIEQLNASSSAANMFANNWVKMQELITNGAAELNGITFNIDGSADMSNAVQSMIEAGKTAEEVASYIQGLNFSDVQFHLNGETITPPPSLMEDPEAFVEWWNETMAGRKDLTNLTASGKWVADSGIPQMASGGSGGGGGGGGSSKTKEKKNPTDERDRYHTITEKIDDATNAYDELSKAEDRAFGKERIKAMEGITDNLKLQIELQKRYIDEIKNYLIGDREAVEALGAQFDINGVITNYDNLIAELVNKYNEGVDLFNAGDIDEDAFKEQYEEPFNDAKDAIDQYVETINLLQSEELNLIDLQNDLADQLREIAAYKLELNIDLDEDELKYLDFLLEMLGDNAEKAVDALTLLGQKFNTTKTELDHYVDGIKDLLALRGFSDSDIAAFLNGELTVQDLENRGFTTDDIDKLREYRDAIQENTEALKELQEEIEAKFLDVLDELNEKVEDAEDRFNHFTKMFEHFQNVVDIVGQDALGMTAETMKMLAQAAKENAIEMVKAAKTQLDSLIQVRAQAQAQLDAALEAQKNASTEEERIRAEEAAKYWSDMVDETQNRIDEAQESLADALENALESIKNEFSVALQQATKEFEASVTGNMKSLDLLATNFDRSNEVEDLYIPAYEKIYELTKLTRDINKSIDDTDSLWSKRELAKIQDEINQKMEDGVQLTEHDVEELRRRYELKLAEAALEEAQNSKNTVRMSRDNEGNWSYVYTADENDVAAAQQNYEDKLYEYQKMNADYIRELQENMIQVEQDMRDAINDLDVTSFASQEEYYAEVQRIIDAAQAKQQAYYDQMAQTLEQQGILYNEDWQRYHDLTGYRMARDEDWVNKWNETTIAQLTGFETLDQYFNALNEAIGDSKDENSYVGQICKAYREMQESNERALNAAGTSMNTYSQDVTSAVNDINEEIEDTQNKVEEFSEKMADMMKDVSSFIGEWKKEYGAAIEELTRFNDDLYKSCEKLITMLQKTYGVNAEFEGSSSVNDNGTEGGPSGSTRNGDSGSRNNSESGSSNISDRSEQPGNPIVYTDPCPKGGNHDWEYINTTMAKGYHCRKCNMLKNWSDIGGHRNYTGYKSGGYTGTWISSAKTGMYTGSWAGPDLEENGRLAFLHQKELVLNANDTKNFLSAIDMVRQISDTIDLQAASRSGEFNFLLPGILNKEPDVLDQNVHIEAHFPNVTSHSEIEEAFTNLVGKASQFANR